MKLLKISLTTLFLITSLNLASCASYVEQVKDNSAQENSINKPVMDVEHFTLDNGLEVFLTQNNQTPRFLAQIVVKAGSKNDPPEATGMAHYLEHMLFKGSEELGTTNFEKEKPLLDEITKLYDQRFLEKDNKKIEAFDKKINELSIEVSKYAVAGELNNLYNRLGEQGLNAFTSNEETVFTVDLPNNRLEQWAMIESNRFAKPIFRLFQSELENVFEEKNISLDDRTDILWEAIAKQLYKNHPYRHETLGEVEHIKNPSLSKMYEFYRKNYVPNNMAIVISGDIDLAKTKEVITKYFSSWKKGDEPKFDIPKEEDIKGVEKVSVNYKGEEKVMMAFRTVPYKHEDKAALSLIDMLLDSGEVGVIKQNLVNPQKLRSAGSFPVVNNDYGAEYIYGLLNKGQTHEEVQKLLLDQIDLIKQGKFSDENLKAIILNYEIDQKKSLEHNDSRVSRIVNSVITDTTVEDSFKFIDKLKKVTKEDIIKVANKYFNDNYVVGYLNDKEYKFPKITKPSIKKVSLNPNQKSEFAKSVESFKVEPIQPRWVDYKKDFKVKNIGTGVLLYYVYNPLNDIFNLSIGYDYGDKHYKNFCPVMDELNFASVGDLKAEDVRNDFYKMGISNGFSCGNYGFSFSISGLDSQLEKGLELSEKLLWNAKLDEEVFKNKIKNAINSRDDEKKDMDTLDSALLSYVNYGEKSGFLERSTKNELMKLSTSEYPKMIEKLKEQNFTVYYSGQLPIEKVEAIVKKYHQPSEVDVPLLNGRKSPPIELVKRENKGVKIYFLNYKSAQSHLYMVIPGKEFNETEIPVNKLFNNYIYNTVYQEIRESRSLAYSTWAAYYQGGRLGDQDMMLGYIGTQNDKLVTALSAFVSLFKNPPKNLEYFESSKRLLDNSYRTAYIGFRGVVGSVLSWGDRGFAKDPRPEFMNQINTMTYDDMKKYFDDKISSKNFTFVVVGDKTKIDMKKLKQIGNVEEVNMKTIFTD